MQHQKKAARSPALDIVRCFALLCVVSVHFFLNTSYYSVVLEGNKLYLMTLIRTGAMICVPLFIMLSGYLMRNKKPTADYFSKIGKTLGTYALAGVACTLYMALHLGRSFTLYGLFESLLNYSMDPYGWYIEMYIGLFLMIPFLNLAFNNIDSQKNKKILLAVMIFSTVLPSVANSMQFTSLEWWKNPASSANYTKLLPSWWLGMYPVTYYFLGCYLREYPLKMKRWTNLLLIVLVWFIAGSYTYYRTRGSVFINGEWTGYYSLFTLVQTVLVFNFLAQGKYEKTGKVVRSVFAHMSEWCLGAYLLSYIFDAQFYPVLRTKIPEFTDQFTYYPVIVAAVYIASLLASGLMNMIQRFLSIPVKAVCASCREGIMKAKSEGTMVRLFAKIAAYVCAFVLSMYAVCESLPGASAPGVWAAAVIGIALALIFAACAHTQQRSKFGRKAGAALLVVSLILSVAGTAWVFSGDPAVLRGTLDVTVTCGEKGEESNGYEVWITGCNVNGIKQPIQSLEIRSSENFYPNESQTALLYNNVDQTGHGQITFVIDGSNDDYELVFVAHAWSGMVEVTTNNGTEPIIMDLYSEEGGQYNLQVPEMPLKPMWNRVLLFAGYALIFASVLLPLIFAASFVVKSAFCGIRSMLGKKKKGALISANSIDALLMGVAAVAVPFSYLLFLFTNNSGELMFNSLLALAGTVAAMALAAYIVMYAATRHSLSSFAAGVVVSLIMFTAGYADDALKTYCGDMETMGLTLSILGGAGALLLLPLVYLKHKKVNEVRISTTFITIIMVMLLVFNMPKALSINSRQIENNGAQYIKTEYNIDSTIQDSPNIYWLHCDSMLGFDAYEKYYGDDQKEFEAGLQERGFMVNRSAMFEGGHTTTVCLPSLMCPDFYDQYVTPRIVDGHLERSMGHPDGIALQSVASTMRANLELTGALRSVGYTVALNTANWSGGIYFADTDEKYESPDGAVITRTIEQRGSGIKTANANGTKQFAEVFVRPLSWAMSVMEANTVTSEVVARVDGSKVNRAEGATLTVVYADPLIAPDDGKSRLVFIVFNDAHTPFDINENGEWITEGNTNVLDYEAAHRFSQKVVTTMVDSIIAKDPNAIIVIQADHGLHGNLPEDFREAFGEDAQEKELWNCVISAIRVPQQYQNGEEQYAASNPLNMSRYIVNRFVGDNYEYLPANESLLQ